MSQTGVRDSRSLEHKALEIGETLQTLKTRVGHTRVLESESFQSGEARDLRQSPVCQMRAVEREAGQIQRNQAVHSRTGQRSKDRLERGARARQADGSDPELLGRRGAARL